MAQPSERVSSLPSDRSNTRKFEESSQMKDSPPLEEPSRIPSRQLEIAEAMAKVPIEELNCDITTPGPIYMLPPVVGYKDHDITKWRAPAYTIARKRPGPPSYDVSPGPIYGTSGLTRFGKAHAPRAKLLSRPPISSLYADVLGPGPDMYAPEKHYNAIFRRAPGASVKGRKYVFIEPETPGPTYEAERVIGRKLPIKTSAPSATVTRRPFDFSVYADTGPGPGHYNPGPVHVIKKRAPRAKINSRLPLRSVYGADSFPGPNAYFPNPTSTRAPRAFLGVKHSKCKAPVRGDVDTFSLVDY